MRLRWAAAAHQCRLPVDAALLADHVELFVLERALGASPRCGGVTAVTTTTARDTGGAIILPPLLLRPQADADVTAVTTTTAVTRHRRWNMRLWWWAAAARQRRLPLLLRRRVDHAAHLADQVVWFVLERALGATPRLERVTAVTGTTTARDTGAAVLPPLLLRPRADADVVRKNLDECHVEAVG